MQLAISSSSIATIIIITYCIIIIPWAQVVCLIYIPEAGTRAEGVYMYVAIVHICSGVTNHNNFA